MTGDDTNGLPGTPFAHGSTAEIRRLGDGRLLKLFKPHIDHWQVATETSALTRAHAAGLPVPRVHATATYSGRQGVTLDELTGPSALRSLMRRPQGLVGLLARMAELQVRIHALPGHDLPNQTAGLRAAIDRAALPADLEVAISARLAAAGHDRALCHGDFHLGNLILQADTLYVLDWDKASCGAPAADAARTAVMLRDGKLGGIADSALADPVRAVLAKAYVRAYVGAYRRYTGDASMGTAVAWWLPVATAAKLPFAVQSRRGQILRRLQRALDSSA